MAFHVWDNLAGCYLHSKSTGDRATFPSRHEAEAAIQKFISRRTVKDDWLRGGGHLLGDARP
jgi:hypothetical protein